MIFIAYHIVFGEIINFPKNPLQTWWYSTTQSASRIFKFASTKIGKIPINPGLLAGSVWQCKKTEPCFSYQLIISACTHAMNIYLLEGKLQVSISWLTSCKILDWLAKSKEAKNEQYNCFSISQRLIEFLCWIKLLFYSTKKFRKNVFPVTWVMKPEYTTEN